MISPLPPSGSIPPARLAPMRVVSIGESNPTPEPPVRDTIEDVPMRRSELPTLPGDWHGEPGTKPMF